MVRDLRAAQSFFNKTEFFKPTCADAFLNVLLEVGGTDRLAIWLKL